VRSRLVGKLIEQWLENQNPGTSRLLPSRDERLDDELKDTFPASDPLGIVQPTVLLRQAASGPLAIDRHDRADIVELSDGSKWRIWPGDLPSTLQWLPSTELEISPSHDAICSHLLINQLDGTSVRVIEASKRWPTEEVQVALRQG
jgi:hypothetical protein